MRATVQLAQEVGTRRGRRAVLLRCVPVAGIALLVAAAAQPRTPSAAVDELLAADRAFSTASARTTLVPGLTAMMAPGVIMPVPGRAFADGVSAVRDELARDTLNATSRAQWTPVRGGISADGLHGFTFGYLTVHRAHGTVVPGKYLAYWVKGADGWRVAGYKRARRPEGVVDTTLLAPALPAALQAPARDATAIAAHRAAVMQAERDFAGEAQVVGLRAAFAKYGSADAMNIGGPANAGFVLGNEAIATSVSQGSPEGSSPVIWGADRALVASSGDLGVTFGFIEPNEAPAAGRPKPRFPFFTVWRRAGPNAPWRYLAE
jgi:hypothetical protein